jgi:DNA-directed RNA polymerase specialized sigma24 family protein
MSADSTRRLDDSTAAQQWILSLFLRNERDIFLYAAALASSITDAEDFVPQAVMAALEKFGAYPARPSTPRTCRFAMITKTSVPSPTSSLRPLIRTGQASTGSSLIISTPP